MSSAQSHQLGGDRWTGTRARGTLTSCHTLMPQEKGEGMGSLSFLVKGGIPPTSPVPRPCPCQAWLPGRESGREEIAH